MRGVAISRLSAFSLAFVAGTWLPGPAHAGGVVVIGDGSGFAGPQVHALDADGSVAGGSDLFSKGFLWSGGFVPVPGLPGGTAAGVDDLSADGSVAVGFASDGTIQHPIRWTSGAGTVALGSLAPGASGGAYAVSADGSVVVGMSGNIPFRWTSSGGMLPLAGVNGWAGDVSGDGEVVTGFSIGTVVEAFRWTQAEGMVGIGSLPGCPKYVTATAVSADGGVVAGECWLDDGLTRSLLIDVTPPQIPVAPPSGGLGLALALLSLGIARARAGATWRHSISAP